MADVLDHIPSFGDLRVDDTQVSAFEAARSELAGTLDIPLEEIELGAVVRLDRGFPMIATRSGVLLRAEHAVDFAKGKPGKRGKRSKRAADAEVASSAGVDGMLPSVGDVVAVRVTSGHDMGVILRVLPRRTSFERWRGKNRGERQVLAANVDVIFIVQPLGAERDTLPLMRDRVARSLVLARDCGADPVVVLTKVDRCEPAEVADVRGALRRLAGTGVRVIATSSLTGEGLDEVRSCIPQGSVGMILGESGAGKSTLLNTLGCLDTPTSGEYLLDGISVRTMSKPQRAILRNRKIGFVFQSYNLLAKTTAVENVELPLMYNASVSAAERRQRAIEALQAVGLGDRLEHKSNQMSGGQMQRVAIARALVNNPAVILADEATGNLDTRTSFEILVLFQKLHAEGRTIIFVTHNPEIAQYSSRNIRLRDGHVTEDTVNPKILSAAEALAALPKSDED